VADATCKAKLELGSEVGGANIEHVLASAKALATRCGCHAVTLVFRPKDGYTTVSIGCLRGRKRKGMPDATP